MNLTNFICENGTYSLQFGRGVSIAGAGVFLEVDGRAEDCLSGGEVRRSSVQMGEFGEYSVITSRKEIQAGLAATVRFEIYEDKLFISLRVKNTALSPVVLGKCSLLSADTKIDMGGSTDSLRILCRDGWQHHSEVRMLCDDPAKPIFGVLNPAAEGNSLIDSSRHRSIITGDLYEPQTGVCLNTSFLTFDRANCVIYYSASEGAARAECLCDFAGFQLPAGGEQRSEILRLAADDSYDRCMKGWAEDAALYYKPSFIQDAARGALCVWSWKSGRVGDYCFEDLALRNAKAISERLAGFGFEYFWTSLVNLKDQVPGN